MNKVKIDWEKIIDKSITGKCEAIFEALKWDLSTAVPQKVKKVRKIKETLKLAINLGTLQGQESIIPSKTVKDTTEIEQNKGILTQPVENKEVNLCDLEICKQNKDNNCNSTKPEECPINNDQSVFEKEELLKPKLTPFYQE